MKDHQAQENCSKHGEFTSFKTYMLGGHFHATTCPDCQKDKAAIRAIAAAASAKAKEIYDRKQRFETRMKHSAIPLRFKDASFENYKVAGKAQQSAVDTCLEYAEAFIPGINLMMFGTTGTGKTHLATAIIKRLIENDYSAEYCRTDAMFRAVKNTYSNNSEHSENDVIARYASPDLLVVDEIGAQLGTETEKHILFSILNARYEQVKSTLVISNLNAKGVEEFMGSRLIDRLREGGGTTVIFNWGSARK